MKGMKNKKFYHVMSYLFDRFKLNFFFFEFEVKLEWRSFFFFTRNPFCGNIFKACARDFAEYKKKDISLWIRKRSQSIVIFFSTSIPETQIDWFSINHYIRTVIIKHCWDIFSWKSICCVAYQHACFTNLFFFLFVCYNSLSFLINFWMNHYSSIAKDHQFNILHFFFFNIKFSIFANLLFK